MHFTQTLPAIVGLAAAAPATLSISKRAACDVQAPGITGYDITPDTPEAWLQSPYWENFSNGAADPAGYTKVYSNLHASSNAPDYRGHVEMTSYDLPSCAAQCNSKFDCQAISILVERVPTLFPGPGCENPPSASYIKCVFWSGPVTLDNTVNTGSTDVQFQRVIAGSNAYVKTGIVDPAGFTNRQYFGQNSLSVPEHHIASQVYGDKLFDAGRCAQFCTQRTEMAARDPSERACKFFNTYLEYVNDGDHVTGQICAIYDQAFDGSVATNGGQVRDGNNYLKASSYGWTAV
ncbi:hypothetical protein C1H76_0750 [Elsinoe australis]|uniref:Apple domain-containing protein n=1 Tax=Elsinoe australis TaxID=40998 RepID=A0A4U7BDB4_9PEZI|nr:hypothetical protein C1H76_0750 [Elsinoe australis]